LLDFGIGVTVYESSDMVGGMAKTIERWGQLVDMGPHRFFSSDQRVNDLWMRMLDGKYRMVSRLTRIYYDGRFFLYPIRLFNAVKGLGVTESFLCLASYLKACLSGDDTGESFESWVSRRFGYRLYSIFFKTYSEKLWGIPCTALSADFARQRIRGLSLFEAVKAAIFGGGNRHKTLLDEFAYPIRGAGGFYAAIADDILRRGGCIETGTSVRSVRPADGDNGATVVLDGGREERFDHVVSSMPLTDLVMGMDPPKFVRDAVESLRYRNTILVYLLLDASSPFPDQWIYVHQASLKTGRITNFRNWVPDLAQGRDGTIICMEYWCQETDEMWWETDDALVALGGEEIVRSGLVDGGTIREGAVVRIPKCYPIYERGYEAHVATVKAYMSGFPGVTCIGRYGAFKYNNQDHSVLMGLLAAENIVGKARHDLWAVNSDDSYQEAGRVAETGLDGTSG
jgi:protoporphyrinogen oxidase